jgi:hypothetical protein
MLAIEEWIPSKKEQKNYLPYKDCLNTISLQLVLVYNDQLHNVIDIATSEKRLPKLMLTWLYECYGIVGVFLSLIFYRASLARAS